MLELARGRAEAPGAGTIVNAMATGRGAAFAIDLKIVATVILDDSGKVRGRILDEPGEDTRLMEACVRGMLGGTDQSLGAIVETKSDIPIARGLKSSSACCNATILAAASALRKLGHKIPPDQEIEFVHYPKKPGFLEALQRGGFAAAMFTLTDAIVAPFRHEGTWAIEWNTYR